MSMILSSKNQKQLPVVAIRDGLVYPKTEAPLIFGRQKTVKAFEDAVKAKKELIVLLQKDPRVDDPTDRDLYTTGVLVSIERFVSLEQGELQVLLKGVKKINVLDFTANDPYLQATYEETPDVEVDTEEVRAIMRHLFAQLKKAINLGKNIDFVALMGLFSDLSPNDFSYQVAAVLDLKPVEKQDLLEESDVKRRLEAEVEFLTKETAVLELERKINQKTQQKFEKGMRENVLREKMKAIETELGEDKEDKEIGEYRSKIKSAKMPKTIEEKILKELERMQKMSQYNPESSYVRTYLDWIVSLPWSKVSDSDISIKDAEKILNEDHFGLKKIKERILEYLAVMKLRKQESDSAKDKKQLKPPTILCFVGPPGVGKTSLGRSIARSLNRKFAKISLGGIRDEAEIRGHRRTYVGAMPGRIIQAIKQVQTKNPVFMLDEIDKIGHDFRGDPSSALLEALDPEQNHAFSDHYLEVEFDLSDVMFITTANVLDTIPPALLDRLEVIHFPGYTEDEKFAIEKNYLIPKQMEAHGLKKYGFKITDEASRLIIHRYTREAGVRELERQIATVCRKVARIITERATKKPQILQTKIIDDKATESYLGPYKYSSQVAEKADEIGMSTGLAWTQVGGEILFIEVSIVPGKGSLTLTGKLGDVMKESCQAALTYVRSRWKEFGLKEKFYQTIDIHVHVPEGAVPKDGPSAGIAITTALISALTKIPVKRDVAMTGEITLRGRVLEIGGIKEKIIAAHRAGIHTIIMPKENKKDLIELPDKTINDLKFVYVDHMDQVVEVAIMKKRGKFPNVK
ncbi:MAG: endopeptidase La [Candidatus Roizmanbacteria bacterium]|nr:endopeptidase La [Candidatus Roizmanbacteria bacterium]